MNQDIFYSFELTFGPLAAGASGSGFFQVQTDYDFFWIKSQAFVYDADGLAVDPAQWPLLTVQLQEGASSQQLTNQAAAIGSLFGTAQLPFILPRPHKVAGGATFNAAVKNAHTATAYSVALMFSGLLVPAGQGLGIARARRRSA